MTRKVLVSHLKHSWRSNKGLLFVSVFVLSFCYALTFTIFSTSLNLKDILTQWGDDIEVTVFIEDGLKEENVSEIKSSLQSLGEFENIQYFSKQESKKRFLNTMPGFSEDLVEDNDFPNPFPANFTLSGIQKKKLNLMEEIAGKITRIPGVEDVSYGQEWVSNFQTFVRTASMAGYIVTITMILGSLLIIGNIIRFSLGVRREQISIYELVGATAKYVRTPFVVEGALIGFVSSVVGIFISLLFHNYKSHLMSTDLYFMGIADKFNFLSVANISILLTAGTLIGALGSYICVKRINTGWAATKDA